MNQSLNSSDHYMNGEFYDFIYHGHLFDICGDDFSGETTKIQVFAQLIKRKKDQVIIDLCQKENNVPRRIWFRTKRVQKAH
ncbi:hypothetical protein BpHYR1_018714 [Brachionus plicatilis]|uniref:Uncharacterized protein n=1 Tax=Brachionus plicatilis TaxID=10195 RepID=A0A3M7PH65_BRAPC|nr:hypothetical protein BpHYR1_018714 [Brachionus plicatilis]